MKVKHANPNAWERKYDNFKCARAGDAGALEADFEQIAVFLHEALQIALKIQEKSGPKLVDFVKCLDGNEDIAEVKKRVNEFAVKFPMPGFDPAEMKYKL